MVKYLSDQRNDPYYQTKLSLSQPFQGEVAAQMYPVDEVDLTPSLNMIQSGARAYYAHQGEELQREGLAISYDTYQANRAAQKSREAASEKEKGLKNAMLNDYAIAISRQVLDPYMQDDKTMSPVAAERKLRDLREQYIRMTGGVVNASDLMKIEKDSGVTFTKDLYNADLQRQNEAYKKDIEDFDKVADANWEEMYGKGSASLVDRKTKNQFYADVVGAENGLIESVQRDFTVNSTLPDAGATQGSSMSNVTRQRFGDIISLSLKAKKESALNDEDPEYLRAGDMLETKKFFLNLAKGKVVNVNGQPVTMATLYGEDVVEGVFNRAWKLSGIETPYTDEQKRRKEQKEYLADKASMKEDRNKLLKADIDRNELEAKAGLQDTLSPTGLYLLENANIITNLDLIDPQKGAALRSLIEGNIKLKNIESNIGARSDGFVMRDIGNKAMKAIDPQTGIAIKSANVSAGYRALTGQATDGYVPYSIWDVPSAHAAMEDRENTLLNGNEIATDPNTAQKEKNTELHRNLYLKARRDPEIWNSLSSEEQEDMTRSYAFDTEKILQRNFTLLRENGLSENVAFDTKTGKFVPINFTGDAGSEKEMLLWKAVDNMNNATHTGIKDLDEAFTETQRSFIRDVTDADKYTQKSSTAQLAAALYGEENIDPKKILNTAPGAVIEGMKRAGEATTKGALWVAEKGAETATLATIYGFEKAKEAGEAVYDIVDFFNNPNRNFKEEKEIAIKELSDKFANAVLSNENLSKEEKEKAKEEFYSNVIKPAVDGIGNVLGSVVDPDTLTGKIGQFIADKVVENKESNITKEYITKPFMNMLKTIEGALSIKGKVDGIPEYNVGLISRIMHGDDTVTPEEAYAAVEAIRTAPFKDIMALDAEFHIDPFSKNTAQTVAEYADKIKSKPAEPKRVTQKDIKETKETLKEVPSKARKEARSDIERRMTEIRNSAYPSIPFVNLKAIDAIMNGEGGVSPEQAKAALLAYNNASLEDKRKLDKRYDIGVLSRNIESKLKEAARE